MIQLDVLRGIAILLVLCRHTVLPWSDAGILRHIMYCLYCLGWTGVDLFFVLSGFLIGGLLFTEIKKTGRLRVKRFLIRRGFKIWPAYLFYIAIVFALVTHELSFRGAWTALWPNLVHLQNYFFTKYGRGHTWSLAVEEHFYVLLPFFLLLVIPHRRASGAMPAIPIVAVALVVICTTLRIVLRPGQIAGDDWAMVIAPTHLRIDSLFFGVMLAYFYHIHPVGLARFARHRWLLILAGLALISPMAYIDQLNSAFVYTIGLTMLYLGYGCILLAFVHTKPGDGPLGKALSSRVAALIAWIGVFSYSIYLWHIDLSIEPIKAWVMPHLPHKPVSLFWLISTVLSMTLAVLAGVLMAKLIEMPVLTLREKLFPREDRPVPKPAPAETTEVQAPVLLEHQASSV